MFIVYEFIFESLQNNNVHPYRYIGSKANCTVEGNKIFDCKGREYRTSCSSSLLINAFANEEPKLNILYVGESSKDINYREKILQLEVEADSNTHYFNRCIAPFNNFIWSDYATFKHVGTGKYARLRRDHPLVLSKEYVGTTKGRIMPEEERQHKRNVIPPNKGVKQDSEFCEWVRIGIKKFKEDNPDRYAELRKSNSEVAINTFRGVPKSEEHKRKIGEKSKDKIVVYSETDGKYVKISTKEYAEHGGLYQNIYQRKRRLIKEGVVEEVIVECPKCGKKSDLSNATFKQHHFENCGKERKILTCHVCGKEGKGSAAFKQHHFENCGKERDWVPWLYPGKNLDKLKAFYLLIGDLYQVWEKIPDKDFKSKKKISSIIYKEIPKDVFFNQHCVSMVLRKFSENYSPLNDKNWITWKNENSKY